MFVDYGDRAQMPTQNLRCLKQQHVELPAQAVRCALDGVEPPSGDTWSEEAVEAFEGIIFDLDLQAEVR